MREPKVADMKKDFSGKRQMKLLSKQRVLLLIWALTFVPAVMYFGVWVTGVSAPMFYVYAIGALALWGLAGVVIFLVPAIAVWWERRVINKQ